CDDTVNGKIITILGVTFKPDTDDMRDAPALTIVPALVGQGAKVRVVDPQGQREGEDLLPGVAWFEDIQKAVRNAECLIILTEWDMFAGLDLADLVKRMRAPRFADLRNMYSMKEARRAGFEAYSSIGRSGYLAVND
ncbi:MAG: UDP binding domain-containing protein, partial [Halocynthiibacter sp.]